MPPFCAAPCACRLCCAQRERAFAPVPLRAPPISLASCRRAHTSACAQVRGKDGVGAKMDSMDLEREKGITIKARPQRAAQL